MSKYEKIVSMALTFSMLLLIISSIYTFYQIKPQGYVFNIEKLFRN